MTIAQFKEEYFGISTILKERLDELYKGKKWRQINRLDEKEVWLHKIHAVSRAIGTVNITLLKISLKLIKESIDFFLKQKRELLGGREDESDEEEVKENTSETGVTKEPQRKVSNTKLSRNITKINDNSGERVSIEQKSSMTSHSIFKMNSNKKGAKLSSTKIKDNIIQNEAQTQLSRGSSVASKARRARKSMSTQKTVMARSGFKNNKMPSFGGANFR